MFGFSAGGFAALLALLERKISIAAAVLARITKDLVSAVDTFERGMKEYYPTLKNQYPWVKPEQVKYLVVMHGNDSGSERGMVVVDQVPDCTEMITQLFGKRK
ncbi:MAG: hypothetical protein BRC42_15540 [Cyanobacteria bacterium QS_1_48_34]|nr:MAG: hypothetical protein BRC42_15540 [Cyanobacteria bacterium QS_1_48_34]